MVAAVLARPLRWARGASARVLTGLAALALAAGLGAAALTASAPDVASAVVAAPVPAAVTRVDRPAADRAEAPAAAPGLEWVPDHQPAPASPPSSDEQPAGASHQRAAGGRAPPAARA